MNSAGIRRWRETSVPFFANNQLLLVAIVAAYLPLVFLGRKLMERREPFELRRVLQAWNLAVGVCFVLLLSHSISSRFSFSFFFSFTHSFCIVVVGGVLLLRAFGPFVRAPQQLFVFSAIGAVFTVPLALSSLVVLPGKDAFCSRWVFGLRHAATFVYLFNMSKFFELGDTVRVCVRQKKKHFCFPPHNCSWCKAFIVLRKRPLHFLHYYHHVVTLLFCWYSNQVVAEQSHGSSGFFFASINYGIHSIMYFYYWLRSCGYSPPVEIYITSLQIAQVL